MAQQLRTFVVITEDPGSIHNTHMVTHNGLQPFLAFMGTAYMWCIVIHVGKVSSHIK